MNKKTTIILGMHRSGTSCLAGSLQEHGLYLHNVFTKNPYNLKGNREHQTVMLLNEDILKHSGGSWISPPKQTTWSKTHIQARDSFIQLMRDSAPNNHWGFKDPRTLFTLPFWLETSKDINFVATFRKPSLVIKSLCHRDQTISFEKAANLWFTYNEKLLDYCKKYNITLINFDSSPADYQIRLDQIVTKLGLENNNLSQTFFDPKLRSQELHTNINEVPANIYTLYKKLLSTYQQQLTTTNIK